jgi:hypothetical protein
MSGMPLNHQETDKIRAVHAALRRGDQPSTRRIRLRTHKVFVPTSTRVAIRQHEAVADAFGDLLQTIVRQSPWVESLDLTGFSFQDKHAAEAVLQILPNLNELVLVNCSMPPEFKLNLFRQWLDHGMNLCHLTLTSSLLTSEEFCFLARGLVGNQHKLSKLVISCRFGNRSAQRVADSLLFNNKLQELHFSTGEITDLAPFCRALRQNRTLTVLGLSSNRIESIDDFAEAVKVGNTIEVLVLSNNRISCTKALAVLLEATSLRTLNLQQNELGEEEQETDATRRFAGALASISSLQSLNLWFNPISSLFLRLIQSSLKDNTTLTSVKLPCVSVHDMDAQQAIMLAVAMNKGGRGLLRQGPRPELLPYIYMRVSSRPQILYALLREVPHLWIPK